MTDDLVEMADGFRLGAKPTDEQVDAANWLIDRMTARIEALEAENARLRKALKFIAEESNSVDEAWAIAKLALENE